MKEFGIMFCVWYFSAVAKGEISNRDSVGTISSRNEKGNGLVKSEEKSTVKCPGRCFSEKTKPEGCHYKRNTDCGSESICCFLPYSEMESASSKAKGHLPYLSEVFTPMSLDHGSKEKDIQHKNPSLSGFRIARNQRARQMETRAMYRNDALMCHGQCLRNELLHFCENPVSNSECGEGKFCCVFRAHASNAASLMSVADTMQLSLRPLPCPETCMPLFLSFFCEGIARDYYCPDSTKCCISGRLSVSPREVPCIGSCIPVYLSGFCVKPLELNIHTSTCPKGRVCCQKATYVYPQFYGPTFERLPQTLANVNVLQPSQTFPSRVSEILGSGGPFVRNPNIQFATNQYPVHRVNGFPKQHVMPINTNGQIVSTDHFTNSGTGGPSSLFTFLHGGNSPTFLRQPILIPKDQSGKIDFQQYFILPSSKMVSSGHAAQISDSSSKVNISFQGLSSNNTTSLIGDNSSSSPTKINGLEIVNERGENVYKLKNGTKRQTNVTSTIILNREVNPLCPGSCISSFLRFTCFGRHALYPGFHCAATSRTICCASLSDIQKREKELKEETSTKLPSNPHPPPNPTSQPVLNITCGIKGGRRRQTPRVAGGFDSKPGEWCWQVAVINSKSQYICGGTLIDRHWVVTAAHCIENTKHDKNAIFIRAGETDLASTIRNSDAQTRRVSTTYVHHNHNSETLDNDIALLKLQDPVKLSSDVCLVCLPSMGVHPRAGTRCTVSGYGFMGEDGPIALRVRHAEVSVVSDEECAVKITEAATPGFSLPLNSFCAGGEGSSDSCQGDGGGPLVCKVDKHYELSGVVSWGLGCGRQNVPGLYVRVSAFIGWMNQIISVNSS